MGVGRPDDLLHAVAQGFDLFDCVLPTRAARHGLLYTSEGTLVIKQARFREDPGPSRPGLSLPHLRPPLARVPSAPLPAGRADGGDAPDPPQPPGHP